MKLTVEKPKVLEDGSHKGTIVAVEYREKLYKYTDIVIQELDSSIKLKAGYPTVIMLGSKLGKLLTRFGIKLVVGETVDPDSLIATKCLFTTVKNGKYADIIPESVKPR